MPPKKKKVSVNPIVVGTVSTRSTRRQSIVNIDIPKSKSKNTGKVTKSLKGNSDFINEHASTNLAKQIRASYSRVLKNKLSESISAKKTDPKCIEKHEIPTNQSFLPNKIHDMSPKLISKLSEDASLTGEDSMDSNDHSGVRNEAIREILEDWTDDESQDSKRKTIGTSYNRDSSSSSSETERTAYFENLEFGAEDINEIIGDNFRSIKSNASNVTDVNEIELTLASGEGESKSLSKIQANVDLATENNILQTVSSCLGNEVDIEPNVETFDDMLDCVNEEIVTESNEEDIVGYNPLGGKQDEIKSDNVQNLNEQLIHEGVVLEDTLNSLSTNDSNDAEVQSFFSKEIENNQIVNKEDIPYMESSSNSTDQIDMLDNKLEISDTELSTLAEQNSSHHSKSNADECEKYSTDNSDHKMSFTSLNELRSTLENDSSDETKTFEDNLNVKDCEGNIFQMDHKTNPLTNDEYLEIQIADLKLEEPITEDDIRQKVSALNINVGEQNSENLKASDDQINSGKDSQGSKKYTKKLTLRTTRTSETKTSNVQTKKEIKGKQQKTAKPDSSAKQKKSAMSKSKPAKDIKTKNKSEVTKTSKILKQKSEKPEKKDKKSDIDFEDADVRRSSRIKSISVLKKKTSGHGLVRSKSEQSLIEADTCDTSSTQTESERGTPVPSPKVTRERKTRWSKSIENLSNLSQVFENKIDNLSEPKINIDEKRGLLVKDPVIEARLKSFVHLKENLYKTDRMTCKEAKKMTCDCFLTQEEVSKDEYGCGEDCLNRLLLIEW